MIYIIIGPSCSGKSTFIKNTWLNNSKTKEEFKSILPYTLVDKAVLLGKYLYDNNIRMVGGDRVERCAWMKIVQWIDKMKFLYPNNDIVIDGFKALTYKSMEEIVNCGHKITIILITCSNETSLKRNLENGTKTTYSTLKSARTISSRLYLQYKDKLFDERLVFTDSFNAIDFENFNLKNIDKYSSEY